MAADSWAWGRFSKWVKFGSEANLVWGTTQSPAECLCVQCWPWQSLSWQGDPVSLQRGHHQYAQVKCISPFIILVACLLSVCTYIFMWLETLSSRGIMSFHNIFTSGATLHVLCMQQVSFSNWIFHRWQMCIDIYVEDMFLWMLKQFPNACLNIKVNLVLTGGLWHNRQ